MLGDQIVADDGAVQDGLDAEEENELPPGESGGVPPAVGALPYGGLVLAHELEAATPDRSELFVSIRNSAIPTSSQT